MTLAKSLGVSEERLSALRSEAQRTFEHGAAADFPFYKTWKRAISVRFVAWYRGIVNRASGRYAELLAEAAKYHKGFGPEQHRDIEKEAQDFARGKIAQSVVRDWLALFLGNRIEPGFSKMLAKVVTELADHNSLISEARANLARAAAIYGEKPKKGHEEPLARLSLEACVGMKSLNRVQAAQTLGVAKRTIHHLVKTRKLNPTPTGRIVCDETFAKEYNRRHIASARKQ